MKVISTTPKRCICCMKNHNIETVEVLEHSVFKGKTIEYIATYEYCSNTDEYWESDDTITTNNIALKNAYRSSCGLLTSNEILKIRQQYGITQSDLSRLLGWGEKTITRYETHQVQDAAHDAILKKLSEDPEWFLSLLNTNKNQFSPSSYEKYVNNAKQLFEQNNETYLRKVITAKYAKIEGDPELCGGTHLDFNKITEIIAYFCNSSQVTSLYKVKLMKLLWYSDALSFKRHGHSITGLAYTALSMGAVPLAHEYIIDLNGIQYEEVDFSEGTGIHFIPSPITEYNSLDSNDINILDTIINTIGNYTKGQIVERMHSEQAYIKTHRTDYINYRYATLLSID